MIRAILRACFVHGAVITWETAPQALTTEQPAVKEFLEEIGAETGMGGDICELTNGDQCVGWIRR